VKINFLQLLGKNTFIYSSLVFALKIDNITGEIQHIIFFLVSENLLYTVVFN